MNWFYKTVIYTERQYVIVLMKLTTSPEKKTLKSKWRKIVLVQIHKVGNGERINAEDIKEAICLFVSLVFL